MVSVLQVTQGSRKLTRGGAAGQNGDSSKIEARSADYSARSVEKTISAFIFTYRDGLSWHFRILKTRKRRFQTI